MGKIKSITMEKHNELSHMKPGSQCQKHYARLPFCNCEKYERLIDMWENLADSQTRCFGDYDEEYPSCGKCNFKEMCQLKKIGVGK